MGLPSFLKSASAKVEPLDSELKTAVREALADSKATEDLVDSIHVPLTESLDDAGGLREQLKLDKLVQDDFPFDDSQIEMIDGVINHVVHNGGQGACATGAAGTGKTTSTKKIVDRLMASAQFLRAIDMETYFKKGKPDVGAEDDDYEIVNRWVPSIAMVGFTGRSTQMIKKNFPRSWHGNIMTIHRCLAFMPVWEEYLDTESDMIKKKMHFEPTFNAMNLLPWDIIIIDEAGMVGLDLWEQLRSALKPTCKIIMIGDINQLPPVHGRSIFGFALGTWPAWELTHVHRQQDSDDRIVDNAWRILKGQMPVSGGNFQMVKFDELATKASQQVRKFLPQITDKGLYDPIRDSTITATNGLDGQRGFALGQLPLNREFAIIFNKDNVRYIIDAGRERQRFAVGDKVMATRNDHDQGITNGMTGIITEITENGAYAGDRKRFGTVKAVNDYMMELNEHEEEADITVEDMLESYGAQEKGKSDAKESRDRGPASHIVTVRFGSGDHGFEIAFGTLAEVASLMTAYVVTCHKMQGGECPVVVIILHTSHKAMHFREWLYTAVTRGSEKVILLYTDQALRNVLAKQKIKGSTLSQKVAAFMALSKEGIAGAAVKVTLTWGHMSQLPAERQTSSELSDESFGDNTDIAEPFAPEYSESSESSTPFESRRDPLPDWMLKRLVEMLLRGKRQSEAANPDTTHDIPNTEWTEVDPAQKLEFDTIHQMMAPPETLLLTYQPQIIGWIADESYVEAVMAENFGSEGAPPTFRAAVESTQPTKPMAGVDPITPTRLRLNRELAETMKRMAAPVQTIPSRPIHAEPSRPIEPKKGSLAFLMANRKK